jgi:hypothetical protein
VKCHDVSGRDLIALLAARPPAPKGLALVWVKFQAWVDWAFQTDGDHLPKPFQNTDNLPKAEEGTFG